MKKENILRILSTLLSLALISSLIPFLLPQTAVHAADSNKNSVLTGIDSCVLSGCLDVIEDDFNLPTVGWDVKGASSKAVTALDKEPYSVYEGSRSLLLTAEEYKAGNEITLSKTPDHLSGFSQFSFFSVTLWIPENTGSASVTLSVRSKGGNFRSSASVPSGSWQTVFFSLEENSLSGKITSLSLSVQTDRDCSFGFLVDMCGCAVSGEAPLHAKYMAPAYTGTGCILSEGQGSLVIGLAGSDQSIEAESPYRTDFTGNTGIRIRFINHSSCRSVTLYYTTISSAEYSEKLAIQSTVPNKKGPVSCTFRIPDSYIGKFKIVFDGNCSGNIELLSVSPALCYTPPSTAGKITGCTVSPDKKNIIVKGSVRDEDSVKYGNSPIYLYELDLNGEPTSITTDRVAISETRLNGSSFTFSFPISAYKNELYRKYAVMVYYSGSLIPIGHPVSVTNPEIFAYENNNFKTGSVKGIYPAYGSVIDGVCHTAVEVRLDRIITFGKNGAAVVNSEFSIDAQYTSELDRIMKNYENCGINVIFILRAGYSDDISISSVINHPSSGGGRFSAFNTETESGINALRYVSDFLVRRYSSEHGITSNAEGFVVGSGINDAAVNYNMGDTSLARLIKAYTVAFRIVYNTVKSVSSGVSVYIPLSGKWYSSMTVNQTSAFDARTVFESFADSVSAGGNIGWKISYDIYSGGGPLYWENTSPDRTFETPYITMPNLEVLTGFLKGEPFIYGKSARNIILLETEPKQCSDANEYIRSSADYVCSYLRLSDRDFSSVSAFIPAHPVNYNNTLKYIDTNRFNEVTLYAKELAGEDLFESLILSSPARRYTDENKAVSVIPSAVKGESVLFEFSDSEDGWKPLINCAGLRGGTSLGDRNSLLSARFSSAANSEPRGIDNSFEDPIDLSAAEYIGFEIQPAVLPEGVGSIEISLVLWSGSSYLVSSCTVDCGKWSTVVADLSGFPKSDSVDRMSLLIHGKDGQDIGEPTVIIGNIRAMSTTFSGKDLDDAIKSPSVRDITPTVSVYRVAAAAVILVSALTAEAVRIRIRKKKNRAQ